MCAVDRYLLSTYCLPDLRLGVKETSMSDTGKESGPHGAGFPGEGETAHDTSTPVSVTHALAHVHKRTLPLPPRAHAYTCMCAPGACLHMPGPRHLCTQARTHAVLGLTYKNNLGDDAASG